MSDSSENISAAEEARILMERELAWLQALSSSELWRLEPHKLSREYVGLAGNKYALIIEASEFDSPALRIVVEIYRYSRVDNDWAKCLADNYLLLRRDGGREIGTMSPY